MVETKEWWKSKTVWTALAGICIGIGAFFAGEIDLVQLLQAEVVPFGLIFLRLGTKQLN